MTLYVPKSIQAAGDQTTKDSTFLTNCDFLKRSPTQQHCLNARGWLDQPLCQNTITDRNGGMHDIPPFSYPKL